jgi:transposase
MHDKQLYAQILGVRAPWQVVDVVLSMPAQEVRVVIRHDPDVALSCPQCGATSPRYDGLRRTWRHLDTCQYRTMLEADVPRVRCAEHGVHQVKVPWAEPGSRFTALFESLVIDWLRVAAIQSVANLMRLSWHEAAGIQERAVRRGLARRKQEAMPELGVDETSFQKRHKYVTVVIDQLRSRVVFVGDDRRKSTLDTFWRSLSPDQLASVDYVAMDMCQPYIQSTLENLPFADQKIAFDKFHVAQLLGDAVDQVRRAEHRELSEKGDERLKGTRYLWLRNPELMSRERWNSFAELRNSSLKVAKAWTFKETAMQLWGYVSRGVAHREWKRWIAWARRSSLEPIRRVGTTIRNHLEGVLNAIVLGVTNARGEAMNTRIQWLKRLAFGFRNRERFRDSIYFHFGGLDLYPSLPS